MAKTITLDLRPEDAAPILREAAEEAAKYGAWCDYIDRRTGNCPREYGESLDDARKRWMTKFLRAKRVVEAFGVEYEPTSEEETMTVDHPWVGGKTKVLKIPGIGPIGMRSGSKPDFSKPFPSYRREVHAEACRQAAKRVVRAWRAALAESKAA